MGSSFNVSFVNFISKRGSLKFNKNFQLAVVKSTKAGSKSKINHFLSSRKAPQPPKKSSTVCSSARFRGRGRAWCLFHFLKKSYSERQKVTPRKRMTRNNCKRESNAWKREEEKLFEPQYHPILIFRKKTTVNLMIFAGMVGDNPKEKKNNQSTTNG